MVNVAILLNFVTTMFTFFEGVVEQVAPLVNKILDRKTTPPPQPSINPNCQLPRCGDPPYYCPDEQLSPICFQRKLVVDNNALLRLTTLSSNMNDDNNDSKEKSSTSMSPSSTIMLVFVFVIALAIIGFLFIRFQQRNDNTRDSNDRKSSTWSV